MKKLSIIIIVLSVILHISAYGVNVALSVSVDAPDRVRIYSVITNEATTSGGNGNPISFSWEVTGSDVTYSTLGDGSQLRIVNNGEPTTITATCTASQSGQSDAEDEATTEFVRHEDKFQRASKLVRFINYTDPRPKGDDADKGSQPSWYPTHAVNAISLNQPPKIFSWMQ